jgi:hypothetical protein
MFSEVFFALNINFGTRFLKFSTNLNYKNFEKHVTKFCTGVKSEYWAVKNSHGGRRESFKIMMPKSHNNIGQLIKFADCGGLSQISFQTDPSFDIDRFSGER